MLLVACAESAPEEFQIPEHERGTVYACATWPPVEYCFAGEGIDLSRLVHAWCLPSDDERFFVAGKLRPVCWYCCGEDCPPFGSNALNGAFCP